jgi:hypothetical protein
MMAATTASKGFILRLSKWQYNSFSKVTLYLPANDESRKRTTSSDLKSGSKSSACFMKHDLMAFQAMTDLHNPVQETVVKCCRL